MSILKSEIVRTYDTRPSTAGKIMDIAEIVDRVAKTEYARGRADAQSHGKWIPEGSGFWKCNNCGYGVEPYNNTPFCPNCGANMETEVE